MVNVLSSDIFYKKKLKLIVTSLEKKPNPAPQE